MPWDFLGTVIQQHGLSAAVLLMVIIASGWAIRTLYLRNQEMAKQMAKVQGDEQAKRSDMREALNKELATLRDAYKSEISTLKLGHEEAISRIQEQWRKEEVRCQQRIDELQEKRIQEAQDFVREATRHVVATREEIGKISKSMEMLTSIMTGRR